MSVAGTLDSTQDSAAELAGTVSPANFATVGTTVYDSLGSPHLVDITFAPALSNAGGGAGGALPFTVLNSAGIAVTAATEYAYTVSSTDGTTFQNGATPTTSGVQYAFFDQNGALINTSAMQAPAAAADVHSAGSLPSTVTGDQLMVTQWGTPAGANNAATSTVTPGIIGIDLSGVQSDASTTSLSVAQNGVAPGTLSNMSVGQDGTITGSFTNGQTVTLGRVAIAAFQNEQGLTRLGNSQYSSSADSGAAQLGTANTGRFGAIAGDSLEMSNVSLADEFTKLITAQNAFTANSKSITTANQNLQTVIGLIR
jgi:flagellar hook protein FlgE